MFLLISPQNIIFNSFLFSFHNPIFISDNQLIIEIDTSNSREDLLETFKNFKLEKLNFNGGVFVAYFAEETELYQVILALGNAKIQITTAKIQHYSVNAKENEKIFFIVLHRFHPVQFLI